MTMLSDLTQELVEEILLKVPMNSLGVVRCTCKAWNALSKTRVLCKAEPREQFLGFAMKDSKLCSMRFDLHGNHKEDGEESVEPSIKDLSYFLSYVKIFEVYHCDGLLLCVTMDNSRLVVWNPYMGKAKWIQLKSNAKSTYALGYDKNKNHKILRLFDHSQGYYEIYDFKSNSWRTFNVDPKWVIDFYVLGESVDGNTYFWTRKIVLPEGDDYSDEEDDESEIKYWTDSCFLICFDFTAERFGQFLSLPFQDINEASETFLGVKEEQLAALYQHYDTSMIEIWITTKIEPNEVSWTPFLNVDVEPLFGRNIQFDGGDKCFFIDVEKKLAVVFALDEYEDYKTKTATSYIIEDNGHSKKVNLGKIEAFCTPFICPSCYVPSLVQLGDPVPRRGKTERNRRRKSIRQEKKRTNNQHQQIINQIAVKKKQQNLYYDG